MSVKVCETCGERNARYVCQECSRKVCERCLEPHTWLCRECLARVRKEAPTEVGGILSPLSSSAKVFFIGLFLIFAGMLVLLIYSLIYGLIGSAGLVVFIGPIPIVLAAGEYSLLTIMLAVFLTIIGIAFFLILRRQESISEG